MPGLWPDFVGHELRLNQLFRGLSSLQRQDFTSQGSICSSSGLAAFGGELKERYAVQRSPDEIPGIPPVSKLGKAESHAPHVSALQDTGKWIAQIRRCSGDPVEHLFLTSRGCGGRQPPALSLSKFTFQ